MPEIWSRPLSTPRHLVASALLGPLCVPGLAFAVRTVASAGQPVTAPSLGWSLLALLGPAIPVYLVVLPLSLDISGRQHMVDAHSGRYLGWRRGVVWHRRPMAHTAGVRR